MNLLVGERIQEEWCAWRIMRELLPDLYEKKGVLRMSDGWWKMIQSIGYTNGGVNVFLEANTATLPEGRSPSAILKLIAATELSMAREEVSDAKDREEEAWTKWRQAKGALEKAQSNLRRGIDDVCPDYKNVHHLPDGFVRMEMRSIRTTKWNNRDSDELCAFQNITEKRWFVVECTSSTINRLIDDVAKKIGGACCGIGENRRGDARQRAGATAI